MERKKKKGIISPPYSAFPYNPIDRFPFSAMNQSILASARDPDDEYLRLAFCQYHPGLISMIATFFCHPAKNANETQESLDTAASGLS